MRDVEIERRIVESLAVASGKGAVEPGDGAQLSRLREQRIARFQFEHVGAAFKNFGIEAIGVGNRLHQEIARAQRPLLLIKFGSGAVGQPDLVGRVVERARRPHRPVHEILAGVLGIGVAVEDIGDGEFAGLDRQPRDIGLAGELTRSAGQLFLLAAEAKGLTQEQPRRVVVRIGEVGFLRFAARKAGGADGVVQAESLQQFRIEIDLAALPEPCVQEQAVAPGRLCLRRRRKTVGAGVGRAERRIALRQISRLAVDFPAVGFRIGQIGL